MQNRSRMKSELLALTLCAFPLGLQAAAHIVDIQWAVDGSFHHQADVAPGKFLELCGAFKPGQKVSWSFKGSAPLQFNIHYHLGKDTVYAVKLAGTREASQTLRVQAEQVHCWMWSNKTGAAAALSATLHRQP